MSFIGALGPQMTYASDNELNADLMEKHAAMNVYSGPRMPGDTFSGWPLPALAETVLPNASHVDKLHALATLKARHRQRNSYGDVIAQAARPTQYSLEERLAMRMGWGRVESSNWAPGFEHVAIHLSPGHTIVHLWVISQMGQAVTLEDDGALFPSDALITKLTLMKG